MQLLARLCLIALMLVGALPLAAQQVPPEPEDGLPLAELVTLPDLLERAVLATQAGDFSQAILDYSLFLLFNPTLGQAWHGRGISHAQNGDYFRALKDYARALDFSVLPENQANVYYDRANVYLRQNRMNDALGDLSSAIGVWPEDVDSRRLRARIMALENQNEAALADYETLLELLPGDVDILLERAYVQMQRGAGAAAARDYDAAVALAPEDPAVLAERAAFRANTGQIAAGLADIDAAIRLDPGNGGFYLFRASLLQYTGDGPAAAAAYLQWLQLIQRELFEGPDIFAAGGETTVPMQPGRAYSFTFDGVAGDTLRASAISVVAEQVDALLVLTNAAGAALIADDDGAGAMDSRIVDYVLPEDGVYHLLLGHAGRDALGDLRVTLSLD